MTEEKKRCEYELFVEEYFDLVPCITNEETKLVVDFGQIVNLLSMFIQSKQKGITLGEANKLIKDKYPSDYDYPNNLPKQKGKE